MNVQKNTAQVWDKVWDDPGLSAMDEQLLATERATVRWQRTLAVIEQQFGSVRGLRVLEIGAGAGTYAALLAEQGAEVTLLDYSPRALATAKVFFRNNKLRASFVEGDALKMPASITKKSFDVSISVGLTEHFRGEERTLINKNHLEVLRDGGLALICVPNAYNFPYRIFKLFSEWTGTWQFGEEYPYTRGELKRLSNQIGGKTVALFGDELYYSIRFLLPANFLRRFFGVDHPQALHKIRMQRGTWLDQYLSYALTLVMRK